MHCIQGLKKIPLIFPFILKQGLLIKRTAHHALACLMLFAATLNAEPLFTAEYQGTYGSMNIKMVRTLAQTGESYTLQSSATSFMASIDEVSHFTANQGQLTANHYNYARKIFGVKKNETLNFDWASNQVRYTKGKKDEGTQKLAAGTLDPTLYQLQLQSDLAQNPEQTSFSYTFARRNHTKTYHFKRQAKEAIAFNGKNYQALVFARTKDDSNKETRLWLIPQLGYALAKIQHTEEDGDTYQVLLTHYKQSPALPHFLLALQPQPQT